MAQNSTPSSTEAASPLVGARARQALKWPCLVREFASISVQTQARRAPARKAPVAGGKEQADESLKDALPEEVNELWQRFVGLKGSNLTRAHATYFFERLDQQHVLGWAPHRTKKPPCYEEYVKIKREHPDKLIAMQVGDFFEFAGWDAVMAIQELNLKGMGLSAGGSPTARKIVPRSRPKKENQAPVSTGDKAANRSLPAGADEPVSPHLLLPKAPTVPPRAGFPLKCSRWEISKLCKKGYVVAIVLQQPPANRHDKEGKVDRYVAQICTPHSPYCQDPTAPTSRSDGEVLMEDPPAWGLEPSVKFANRWTVHMWQRESLTRTSTEVSSFSELLEHLEAARVRSEFLSLPVYFHSATTAYAGALAMPGCDVPLETLRAQEQKVKEWLWRRFEGAPRVVHSVGAQNGEAFVEAVQNRHLFPPQTTASGQQAQPQHWASAGLADGSCPLFLHESTARALGIKPGAAPDIVAEALGKEAVNVHMKKVRGLLMRPPPRPVALQIAAAVRALMEAHVVPRFVLHHNTSRVWSHMQACCASTTELQGLLASATATYAALQQPSAAPIMEPLLEVASWSRGGDAQVTRERLQAGCDSVIALLKPLLPQFDVAGVDASEVLEQEVKKLQHELLQHGMCPEEYPIDLRPLATLFIAWEHKKLYEIAALRALQDADTRTQQMLQKRSELLAVIAHSVTGAGHAHELNKGGEEGSAVAELNSSYTNAKSVMKLIRVVVDGPLLGLAGTWVRDTLNCKQDTIKEFSVPKFREVAKKKFFVTEDLVTALAAYREVVEDLNEEAESVIQQATAALFDGGQNMCTLLAAQEVNEWGSTLAQIAQCATIRRWSLPQLAGADGSLQLKGVWPYWLPRPQPSTTTQHTDAQQMHNNFDEGLQESHLEDRAAAATGEVGMREVVANDLELAQRLMLLTGANMSGKSTLMRAIMASALLGSVGLPVPCIDAIIPEFKSFFYRCFDGDNPLAGLSGHAYECAQMKTLYTIVDEFDSTAAKHLICIDELGKGTEDTSATALCCAALQHFDAVSGVCAAGLSFLVLYRHISWACIDRSDVVGIFATHQHDLVDDRLQFLDEVQRVYCSRMEVLPENAQQCLGSMPQEKAERTDNQAGNIPRFEPTFKVLPGTSCESLALQVALEQGMPKSVVHEAKRFLAQL